MTFSDAVDRQLEQLFPGELADQARRVLRPDQGDRVLHAVLSLSDGDLDRLQHFSDAATEDSRDVLFWAETPKSEDEPRTRDEMREALRDRLGNPPPGLDS